MDRPINGILRRAWLAGAPLAPLVKLGYPVLAWLSTRPPFVRAVNVDGLRFFVSVLDLAVGRSLRTTGRWEPLTTEVVKRLLSPGMVFLDIGAQMGYYTLVASRSVGATGRVFAFEPDQRHISLLRRSLRENGVRNVAIVPVAVFNETGKFDIQFSAWAPKRSVPAVRLDDYFAGKDKRIDLIKMDIDGAEGLALQGMDRVLEANPRVRLIVEYDPWSHRMRGRSPTDLLDALSERGFGIELVIDESLGQAWQVGLNEVRSIQASVNLRVSR